MYFKFKKIFLTSKSEFLKKNIISEAREILFFLAFFWIFFENSKCSINEVKISDISKLSLIYYSFYNVNNFKNRGIFNTFIKK